MSGPLPKHKWMETEDGSLTLYSEEFGEACHSSSGAKSETLLHYIRGCKVQERVQDHHPFVILEVGFGTGLGFETTQEVLEDSPHKWHFISLELDRDLVEHWRQKNPQMNWRNEFICEGSFGNSTLSLVVGDARLMLPQYLKLYSIQFHAIYQDAFSPKRNPTLWTKEWFELLKSFSSSDVILSTYSSSSSIRKSLHEVGWILKKGDKFGPKRSSTRAYLKGISDEEILLHLSRSPVDALSDGNLIDYLKK
jgi:tRNA U34 5-methylaminomethyl-2-thiouridine-forming methyltransferase MnmC